MKLTSRFRVRTLMALVALVALGFGVAFEVRNHAERDRLLKARLNPYRHASVHLMRALECKSAMDRQAPYRQAKRMELLSSDPTRGRLPVGPFRSWQEEFEWHMYWGNRLFYQTQGEHVARDKYVDEIQAVEAKLLLP
jgi:hypothetical protein